MEKKFFLAIVFLSIAYPVLFAQDVIEWDSNCQLQLSDFRSPTTQIGEGDVYSLYSGSTFSFAFQMSNAEFMFTKNFNSKVSCIFRRNLASLVAPDSARATDLLLFSRYEFDLAELYARKTRQQLYDQKSAFSSLSFFQPVFEQSQKEFSERHVAAGRATDLGQNREKLQELQQEVRHEIATTYSDFCKTCKPTKKKK